MRCWVLALLVACGGDPAPPEVPTQFGGDRPVELQLPPLLEGETYPLVLILHGYGASGLLQQAYFGFGELAVREDVFVLAPDGLVDSGGRQFWNADATCCDFDGQNPDDVGYLSGLIEDVAASWPVDPARVRVIGHSNGGFMAYRLACERPDLVTSIVSLAGNAIQPPCAPARPVHVLHVHGTLDDTVPFAGGTASADEWAGHNGCTGARGVTQSLDLDLSVTGAETDVAANAGCPPDGEVELWTMNGSGHVPSLSGAFEEAVAAWWTAHPRR